METKAAKAREKVLFELICCFIITSSFAHWNNTVLAEDYLKKAEFLGPSAKRNSIHVKQK